MPERDRWVAEALRNGTVAPERLALELVETTRVDEAQRDVAIERLSAWHVRLAIDDLGSGYSSLE